MEFNSRILFDYISQKANSIDVDEKLKIITNGAPTSSDTFLEIYDNIKTLETIVDSKAPLISPTLSGNIVIENGSTISGLTPSMLKIYSKDELDNKFIDVNNSIQDSIKNIDSKSSIATLSGNTIFIQSKLKDGIISSTSEVYTYNKVNSIITDVSNNIKLVSDSLKQKVDLPTLSSNNIVIQGLDGINTTTFNMYTVQSINKIIDDISGTISGNIDSISNINHLLPTKLNLPTINNTGEIISIHGPTDSMLTPNILNIYTQSKIDDLLSNKSSIPTLSINGIASLQGPNNIPIIVYPKEIIDIIIDSKQNILTKTTDFVTTNIMVSGVSTDLSLYPTNKIDSMINSLSNDINNTKINITYPPILEPNVVNDYIILEKNNGTLPSSITNIYTKEKVDNIFSNIPSTSITMSDVTTLLANTPAIHSPLLSGVMTFTELSTITGLRSNMLSNESKLIVDSYITNIAGSNTSTDIPVFYSGYYATTFNDHHLSDPLDTNLVKIIQYNINEYDTTNNTISNNSNTGMYTVTKAGYYQFFASICRDNNITSGPPVILKIVKTINNVQFGISDVIYTLGRADVGQASGSIVLYLNTSDIFYTICNNDANLTPDIGTITIRML